MSNSKYIGYIISFEDYFAVQVDKGNRSNIDEDTKQRKGIRYSSQNVLSGLLVCAECDANYRRITCPAGEVIWSCANKVEHGKKICKKVRIFDGSNEIKTSYEYDYIGNNISVLSPKDRENGKAFTSKYEYDGLGNLIKTIDALGNEANTEYDYLGRKISSSDKKGNVSYYKYNGQGLLEEESLPFEGQYRSIYKYVYDNNGNIMTKSTVSNRPGEKLSERKTQYSYDKRNNLIETETDGIRAKYEYDVLGNKTAVILADGEQITYYEYDHLSRLVKAMDPMGQTEVYTYDASGNLISKVDRNGKTTKNIYNSMNLLTQVHIEDMNGTAEEFIKYTYDTNHMLLKEENENISTEYVYDNLGRISEKKDSSGSWEEFSYDLNNNRIGFKLYINNSLTSDLVYEYDRLNRLTKVLDNSIIKATYSYDANGNRRGMETGNGISTVYTYNDANLVKSLTNKKGGNTLSSYAYTYYLDGNQATKSNHNGLVTSYAYDKSGRLTNENQEGPDISKSYTYEYDNASNRSKMAVSSNGETEVTTYTYDKNNRLIKENSSSLIKGEQKTSIYAYDGNGNQISKSTSVLSAKAAMVEPTLRMYVLNYDRKKADTDYAQFSEELEGEEKPVSDLDEEKLNISLLGPDANPVTANFETEINIYDGFNRLVKVIKGPTTAEYKYKSDGLRISKEVNGNVTVHIWDGSNIVADLNGDGTLKDRYVRGINLIESDMNGYYLYDAHGDVVQLSNNDGNVVRNYSYDAFGVEKDLDEEDVNPFRFCGEYFDKETGSIYLRARYYNPMSGRFMTEDPIKDGLNWYTYANNSPILFIDPLGLAATYEKLTDWLDEKINYGYDLKWDSKTKSAHIFLKRGSASKTIINGDNPGINVTFTAGVDGTFIGLDGKMYVDVHKSSGINALWNYIDPPLIYTPVKDVIVLTTTFTVAAKGVQLAAAVTASLFASKGSGSINNTTQLLNNKVELTGTTREKLLSTIQNEELSRIANQLYRPGATIGDGGTASILAQEFYQGSSTHLIKAEERLIQLNNLANSGKLGLNDLDILDVLRIDLENAINLFK